MCLQPLPCSPARIDATKSVIVGNGVSRLCKHTMRPLGPQLRPLFRLCRKDNWGKRNLTKRGASTSARKVEILVSAPTRNSVCKIKASLTWFTVNAGGSDLLPDWHAPDWHTHTGTLRFPLYLQDTRGASVCERPFDHLNRSHHILSYTAALFCAYRPTPTISCCSPST